MSENSVSISVRQKCSRMGLSEVDIAELTATMDITVLDRLPEDKLWLIPLCVIQNDMLCKMTFTYRNLDEFVDAIHNNTLHMIKELLIQSTTIVNPWMGLLVEESGLVSMDAIMCRDWNMEQPVIRLSGMTLKKRAKNYVLAAATSDSIKSLYRSVMIGPVSSLNLDSFAEDNAHELLTRVWHEFQKSRGSSNIGIS